MRAVCYVRISSLDQEKGYSLEMQEKKCREYANLKDYDVIKVYRETSSAYNGNRKVFSNLMNHMNDWDVIIVWKLDRLSRSRSDFIDIMDNLNKNNKQFVSVTENLDTTTPMGKFVLYLLSNIATLESETIGYRTKAGLQQKFKKEKARVQKNKKIYGYNISDKGLTINKDQAKWIKEIFKLYNQGKSMGAIVKTLSDKGCPRKFYMKTIKDVLHNPLYSGFVKWGDLIYKSDHPAIVTKHQFEKAQKIIESKGGKPTKLECEKA